MHVSWMVVSCASLRGTGSTHIIKSWLHIKNSLLKGKSWKLSLRRCIPKKEMEQWLSSLRRWWSLKSHQKNWLRPVGEGSLVPKTHNNYHTYEKASQVEAFFISTSQSLETIRFLLSTILLLSIVFYVLFEML